jgi:hypothetical protein
VLIVCVTPPSYLRPAYGEIGEEPVEADMFDVDGTGNVQVSLLSQETLHIPFTLLSLRPNACFDKAISKSRDGGDRKHERHHPSKRERKGYQQVETDEFQTDYDENKYHRTIEVRFISASHGHVVAVVKVNICYRTGVVDRSIMFFEPENSVMNRRIQLVDNKASSVVPGHRFSSSKYIHCVENVSAASPDSSGSQVLVEWGPCEDDGSGNGLDIILRYRCRAFPEVGSFYLLVYDDPYQCSLYEVCIGHENVSLYNKLPCQIWHVTIHSRQRLDLHCSLGSKNSVDLIVRGDRYARRGRAFSSLSYSYSSELATFHPESYFQLVPGAYNRVVLTYCPKRVGTRYDVAS